jgi:hypothetical protein
LGSLPVTSDELLDRQQIIDCLVRYARGVDRADEELILSAFHEDAVDYHGDFVGSPHDFVAWLRKIAAVRLFGQHFLTNHSFEFDGDSAHVETYFLGPERDEGRLDVDLVGGRYVDRFERREGVWKIARRVVVAEFRISAPAQEIPLRARIGKRSRSDISYLRPLEGPARA